MANCERCEARGIEREGKNYGSWDGDYCEECRDALDEAAWESFLEDYYGGSGPVTINEQYQAAAKQKRSDRC